VHDQLYQTPLFFNHLLKQKGASLGVELDGAKVPLSYLSIEDTDFKVACSQLFFAQNSYKLLKVKRLGKPQKFDRAIEDSMLRKLNMLRMIHE